jgi:hypothetical protein
MSNIIIKIVKKGGCRNSQVGDYFYDKKGNLIIKVVNTGNDIYNRAIAIHELWEESLLKVKGVKEETINAFDKKCFKEKRDESVLQYGDQPDSPYRNEHRAAENIERLFIQQCGEDWFKYDEIIDNL